MSRRSPIAALATSPTLVGAVTVLISIVAVFLAYNANNGLPFVPVYRVSVEIPNAARVTNNNEIRIGGNRVGVVESLEVLQKETQTAQVGDAPADPPSSHARLNLKLDKDAQPLPKDSVFRIRYRSSFGLKYVDIVRGTGPPAPEGFVFDGTDDGAVCDLPIDVENYSEEVPASAGNGCFQQQTEFDDINNTFDRPTRDNSRANLTGYGTAFAARGTSLNDTISKLEPLFRGLKPVSKTLTKPSTRFRRFFPALAQAADEAFPVAREQADGFTLGGVAFGAITRDPPAFQDTISEGPPTLEAGIRHFPAQRAFLRDFTTFSRELRPGVADLRSTLPVLNEAIDAGTPVLARSPEVNRRLRAALLELDRLVAQPETRVTLTRLVDTFDLAAPLFGYVAPAQTVCNYFNYWFTFLPGGLTDRDQVGYALRQSLTRMPAAPAAAESGLAGYSGIGANGKTGTSGGQQFRPYESPITNTHPYGPTGQRNADCQAGQTGYELGRIPVDGQAPSDPANRFSDLPGSRGPTTVFFDADRKRTLADTRVASRAPEGWRRLLPGGGQ